MRAPALFLAVGLFAVDAGAAPAAHPQLLPSSGEVVQPLPPIELSGRTLYAHGADLLEWDESQQAIVARTRLPARIAALVPRDGALAVTLAPKSEFGFARDRIEILMPLGARPGRGFWSGGIADAYLTLREARVVASGFDVEAANLDAARREAILAALLAREKVDRTNAFLPFFRGQLLARAGRRPDALRAFDDAASLAAAPFNDLLRLSPMLEDEDAIDAAGKAFDRGFAALRAAGLRPERLQSQVSYQVLMGVPRHALSAALARGDVDRVDRIEDRVAAAFPRLEGADRAWADLALYMRAHGREDLAVKWSGRAEAASSSASNLTIPPVLARLLPTIVGMSVIAPLIALCIGLRRGARRADSTRRIVLDLLTALAPLLATIALIVWANARIETIARRSTVPMALLDDGAASPDVGRFVRQRLVDSPERATLLTYIDNEANATRAGGRFEGAPPDDTVVRAALDHADVRGALRDAIARPIAGSRTLGFQHSVLAAGLMFLAGYFLGGRTPRAADAASRVVPGAPESLGIVGALLGGVLLGALFAFAGVDRLLWSIGGPNVARYFGLESIATPPPMPSRAWAWAALLAVSVVHLFGVHLDNRRRGKL